MIPIITTHADLCVRGRLIAALNTVEPPIVQVGDAEAMERGKPWYAARLPLIESISARD